MNVPPISLAAEPVFNIGSFVVTNSILTAWISVVLIAVFAVLLNRKMKAVPGRFQSAVESVTEGLYSTCEQVLGDHSVTRKLFPFLASLFVFIVINNLLGLLPGVGTIGVYQIHHGHEVLVPFFRSANADLNMTLALGLISAITTQFLGFSTLGFKEYAGKFFNFKGPIDFFVGILELVSEFARVISFAFRLFGNVFAGEVILMVITALVPVFVAVPFYFMEIFVGFIQGLVFMMLTVVFIRVATAHHAHDH
jgi:F-type H+-transporting ATPase subunit a